MDFLTLSEWQNTGFSDLMESSSDEFVGVILHENSGLNEHEVLKIHDKSVEFKAVLQDFERNRNSRLYTKEVIFEALKENHVLELLENNSWYGECGHPLSKDLKRQMKIFISNSSHRVTDIFKFSDRIEGNLQTTHFENGRAMKDEIVEGGVKTAYSMRGAGPLKKDRQNKVIIVEKGLKILCYDWVVYPSHKTAYQKGIYKRPTDVHAEESFVFPVTPSDMEVVVEENENYKRISEKIDLDAKNTSFIINEEDNTILLENSDLGLAIFPDEEFGKNKKYIEFMAELGKIQDD